MGFFNSLASKVKNTFNHVAGKINQGANYIANKAVPLANSFIDKGEKVVSGAQRFVNSPGVSELMDIIPYGSQFKRGINVAGNALSTGKKISNMVGSGAQAIGNVSSGLQNGSMSPLEAYTNLVGVGGNIKQIASIVSGGRTGPFIPPKSALEK